MATVSQRRDRTTINVVVACSSRKRVDPNPQLRLRSVGRERLTDRIVDWQRRLKRVDATELIARDLYAGDHWAATLRAYNEISLWSPRTQLWIASAGYGLIRAVSSVKSYSATFSSGHADSVWRAQTDAERRTSLRAWWSNLAHQAKLVDLVPERSDGTLIVVLGATYLDALADDLHDVLSISGSEERVSVISAGAANMEGLIPIDSRFRAIVGGTDAALNARALEWLATNSSAHCFRPSLMAATVHQASASLSPVVRPRRTSVTNQEIAAEIARIRGTDPRISRTVALTNLRRRGIACEQTRFASIWEAHAA